MSQQTTIRKLAELVNTPVEKLLEQLSEAGMRFDGPDQVVTSIEKMKLLGFLKRAHGKAETAAAEVAAPKKITLSRSRKQEITVGGGKNRSTVDVVVRKKVTLVKPTEAAAAGAPEDDERAEILRKLEESRQRNLTEQQRLAEEDRRRAEEAERKRREEEAARLEAERAAAAAAAAAREEEAGRRPATHGHGHPHKPATPARDDKHAPKHKTRGSHAMAAGVED
ncbi:MAG: translation initiation factor IF-2, partial [Lysobacteraceae bacterium]